MRIWEIIDSICRRRRLAKLVKTLDSDLARLLASRLESCKGGKTYTISHVRIVHPVGLRYQLVGLWSYARWEGIAD